MARPCMRLFWAWSIARWETLHGQSSTADLRCSMLANEALQSKRTRSDSSALLESIRISTIGSAPRSRPYRSISGSRPAGSTRIVMPSHPITRTAWPARTGVELSARQSSRPILTRPLEHNSSVAVPSEPTIDSGPVGRGPSYADFRNGYNSKSFTIHKPSANGIVQRGKSNQYAPRITRTDTTPRPGSWKSQ